MDAWAVTVGAVATPGEPGPGLCTQLMAARAVAGSCSFGAGPGPEKVPPFPVGLIAAGGIPAGPFGTPMWLLPSETSLSRSDGGFTRSWAILVQLLDDAIVDAPPARFVDANGTCTTLMEAAEVDYGRSGPAPRLDVSKLYLGTARV